jgi:polar amino acid transport system substrate-binding protein
VLNKRLHFLAMAASCLFVATCADAPSATKVLRWGGDSEGGAPFVEADPSSPDVVRGFDVEVAELMARGLGRTPHFVQVSWASIPAALERGDFDVGLSGLEDQPALMARHAATIPYFVFREVLAVRPADTARYRTLDDLAGKRVGTLNATTAYNLLVDAQEKTGVIPVPYELDTHPYTDLVAGRVDAVLLDHIIAERSLRRHGGFVIQPQAATSGHYVALFARSAAALRDSVNDILRVGMRDGTLEGIYRKWNIWDEDQAALFRSVLGDSSRTKVNGRGTGVPHLRAYVPALARAAGITLALSCLAMGLAVLLGAGIAAGRVYGNAITRAMLTLYVEVVRGTPVLLQLFVLYYGLSSVILLPAFISAVVGLGLNYAAYESEIYRGALEAIPKPQIEAARTLGLSELQVFRLVRAPQALRLALAPMTNDFVALLKDSSLVSVITVVELTKQTAIYATNVGSWLVPGVLCAVAYLMMSLPLSIVARRLERRWRRS